MGDAADYEGLGTEVGDFIISFISLAISMGD